VRLTVGVHALGIKLGEGGADGALAGAGLAGDQAEAALLAMHAQDLEDFLLVGEEEHGAGLPSSPVRHTSPVKLYSPFNISCIYKAGRGMHSVLTSYPRDGKNHNGGHIFLETVSQYQG
jgi:hypothetical protein